MEDVAMEPADGSTAAAALDHASGDEAPDAAAASAAAASSAAAAGEDAGAAAGSTEALGTAGDAEDDEEDEVVQECDVYLNRMQDPPDFVGDMYVLQYPLRPNYRPYGDQGELDKVELKPRSRRLRFVYKLHQNANYDNDGLASDKLGQRHVLNSTVVANPACSYAIAVVHQGRMTLTPVRAMNQLRPDFEDYDKLRAQLSRGHAAAAGPDGLPTAEKEESGDSGDEALGTGDLIGSNPVRVDFTVGRKGTPAEAEEPWVRLDYYNRDTPEANDVYTKHIVWPAAAAAEAELGNYEPDHPKLQKLHLDGDRAAFLSAMCGNATARRERKEKKETDDGLSVYVLSRMPIERQVEAIVRHFGVVSYSRQLRRRLPQSTLRAHGNDDILLQHLQRCAVLVAGNWVLRSELAGFEGLEANARDMLLCLFTHKKGELRREEYGKWAEIYGHSIPRATIEEIMRGVAERDRDGETYRLKNPRDAEFEMKFPQVVAAFTAWWEQHRRVITARSGMADRRGTGGGAHAAALAAQSATARMRAKLLLEVQEALALGGKTLAELRRTIQKRSPNTVVREEDILQVLQHKDLGALQVRDIWILQSTGNVENDRFRQVLVALFKVRDSVSKRDMLAEYQRLHGVQCKLSEYQLRGLLRELADRADGDNYVLKGALARAM